MLAPTGTISFLMDCDTTGVEPDFSLVKFKELVGGGQMTIVNRTVPLALQTLGYTEQQIEQIEAHLAEHGTIIGAPGPRRGAPAGVRRGGWRASNLAHGPPEDDGRRAALHLRRHLQDSEPARRSPRSRTSPTPTSRPGTWASRRSRSTATASKTAQALRTEAQSSSAPPPATDSTRRRRGRCHQGPGRGRPAAQAHAARAAVDHPQVLDRGPRGLYHRGHVRGRLGRRDLPHGHRQGGLDAARE